MPYTSSSSITSDQISDFLNANAFAMSRDEERIALQDVLELSPVFETEKYKTSSINESVGILSASIDRLDQMLTNLREMYSLADEASGVNTSDLLKKENYAKLRSLTAGIDTLVDSSKVEDVEILGGVNYSLVDGVGNITKLNLPSFRSYDEDGLNLSRKVAAGIGTISYSSLTQIRNAAEGVIGLDISETLSMDVKSGYSELDDGDYQIKITYEGPDSMVELRSLDGAVISRVEGVDLSGEGKELVDFGNGIGITIDKELPYKDFLDIDKYDYETNGPAELYAELNYERVYQFDLLGSDDQGLPTSSVKMTSDTRATSSTGFLSFEDVQINAVDDGLIAMGSGYYSIQVDYNGDDSVAKLYDSRGNLLSMKRGLALSENGEHTINFGTGVSINFRNADFGDDKKSIRATLEYTQADDAYKSFDYSGFMSSLSDAYDFILAQEEMLSSVQQQMTLAAQYQSMAESSVSTMLSSTVSLLSGASGGSTLSDLFGGSSAVQAANATAEELFGNLYDAIGAQSNVTSSSITAL